MAEKIVVIGNGIAAVTAVKAMREIDKECEIHLLGEERFYPYNRIRLSKGLLSTLEEDKILLQKKEWYEENGIRLYRGIKIISIDIENKSVATSDGNNLHYTKLLFANGARNFVPPIPGIDKEGVYTLKTLENAWDITEHVRDKNTILNIGGGIQGLETAWSLSQMGKKIIIAELLPRLMPRQLDEKASKILEKVVKSFGIEIMIGTQITEITGTDKVLGFKTSAGQSDQCDMVLYSVGVKPNIEILKETPVLTNKGIVVNEKMETNVSDIYAAGDIAEYHSEIYGLWNIAIGHGKVAGYNIMGKNSTYEHIVPVTTLNAFNLSLFSMGIVEEDQATNIVLEDQSEENIYNKVYIKNNKVIGAIVIGDIRHSPALKTAIEKEIDLGDVDLNRVSFGELLEIIKERK
ncbi:NAD(P)/FAD-dependent oxidoreductase [Geosporobacter ferrireducens]|uniref:Pyridine nucleotide-disulfide oxidoreductase n=1 Tax=Geosporobacter ferrireducens TaxID=1424294 RepID=A0A1D8GDP0_9FIRM|nr:FAD-dependent oxidoreductase [Geosporobacter ferrireducens]AOT69014.1 pyridine nucleotide-disulfide oxidoreductase [Geosporobacter ferrireducens]MTI58315.1 NAD(P)/FAD-dependent oxidoreductase [Geosporobacter ferrireducens]